MVRTHCLGLLADRDALPEANGCTSRISTAPIAQDEIATVYASYRPQPIWTRGGINEAAVAQLVAILQRAPFDGFAEGPQLAARVQAALAQARSGDPAAMASA